MAPTARRGDPHRGDLATAAGCTAPGAGGGSAQQELDRLVVVTRPVDDHTYRRAAFGPAWSDVDGNHCRQRSDALFRTLDRSQPYVVRRQGRCSHDVVAGTWTDPYTGQKMTFTNLHDAASMGLSSLREPHRAWSGGVLAKMALCDRCRARKTQLEDLSVGVGLIRSL